MDELAVGRRRGVELPERVQRRLLGLVGDGFTVYCCGPKHDPAALVAAYEWAGHVDLVTIRDFDGLVAAAHVTNARAAGQAARLRHHRFDR